MSLEQRGNINQVDKQLIDSSDNQWWDVLFPEAVVGLVLTPDKVEVVSFIKDQELGEKHSWRGDEEDDNETNHCEDQSSEDEKSS